MKKNIQVCVGEAFSKLAKYKRDSCKWKMPTRNVATYAAIPIPQRARADEELLGGGTVNRVWTRRCVATQQVESVYRTFELCVIMS